MTRTATTRPATRRRTTRARATVRVSPSRKHTIRVSGFAGKLGPLLAAFPALYEIWRKPSIDPAFREELMVAVARQNDAPYCNWAHRTWAAAAGASEAELAKIERLDSRGLDRRKWAAVKYVRALAAADFGSVPDELRRTMARYFTAREVKDIELVARAMDLVNRSSNTYEALLSRLRGKPSESSRLFEEIFFGGVFAAVAPPMVLFLSRRTGRPFLATAHSLVEHVQRHYAQLARA